MSRVFLLTVVLLSVALAVAAPSASAGGYSDSVAADSPISWWRLDEASGTVAVNSGSAGTAGNGTYANVTFGQSGMVAGDAAAGFNGSTSSVANSSSIWDRTGGFSIEAWIRTTSTAQQVVYRTNGTYGAMIYIDLANTPADIGKVSFMFYDSAAHPYSVTSPFKVNDGNWHQVVGTYSGDASKSERLYVDGAQVASLTYTNPVIYTSTGADVGIWSGHGVSHFNGAIDEVALYGSVLSGARIAAHYAAANLLGGVPASATYGGSNGAMPGAIKCQCQADPVNTENGDFFETSTDASVATYGPPLVFSRTYDALLGQAQSASGTPGSLGYGWASNWDASLSSSSGTVTVTQANGAQVVFKAPSGGACTAPYVGSGASGTFCALPAVTASLIYNAGTSVYSFVTHPYRLYTFNAAGQLTGQSVPGGASLSLARGTPSPGVGACPGSATSCNTITAASGRKLVVAFNSAGRVVSVVDPLGHSWVYGYCSPPSSTCSTGDLVSVTDPLGRVTSFSYDAGNSNTTLVHDLLTVTKPNGQSGGPNAGAKLVNVYNGSGQVTSQTDPAGNQTTFDYSNLSAVTSTGYTVETDPDGNKTQFSYNGGLLVSRTAAYTTASAATWTYVSDPRTALTLSQTDPNGHETDYSYDAVGNVATVTDPLGNKVSRSYNGFDEPVCSTAPLAASVCSALSPPAAITAGASTITPPASAPPKFVTYSEYDTNGDLIYMTTGDYAPGGSSASQSRTTYQLYAGQSVTLGTTTDSCGASPPSGSLPCLTINPNGVVTQLGYDATAGDLTSSSTPDGNPGGELATSTYTYDGDGRLVTVTAPKGNLSGASAADFTTTNVWDDANELTSATVSHTGGSIVARTTGYGYDGNGNRTSVADARGKSTTYGYTANDRLALVSDPDGNQTLTCYDGAGNVTETVPPVGVAANSLTASSCPTSYPAGYGTRLAADATSTTFDALGNPVTTTTPAPAGQSGYETTTRTYDPAGRLSAVTAPATSNTIGAPNQTTNYSYDAADRLTSKTVGALTTSASTTVYCYDLDGDRTAVVPPDGNTSSLASCSASSPWQTSSAYQTGYSFDSLGELASTTRPATSAAPGGQTTTYAYDAAGNQTSTVDPNSITTTTTYTPLDQLASVSYSGSSAHSVSYGYDANGNRTSMSDASGSSSYQYDPFDELTSHTNGASQVVAYSYDDDGNTTSITYALGSPAWATTNSIGYAYDDASQLTTVTDFTGQTFNITNTADGLPNSISLGASGDTIATSYDPTDNPSQINLNNSGGTLLGFAYTNTPAGTTAEETLSPTSPASPRDYDYDPQGRITQMTVAAGTPTSYGFDASGNATTLPTGASGSYDHASELTSSTLSSTTTSYSYDAAGNRTQTSIGAVTQTSGSYNGADELTAYSNSTASMSAATYDGDGPRTASTSTITGGSPITQNYVWDTTGAVPQLLTDNTNAYVYADSSTPIEQINLTTGTPTYLLADQLGSIRATVSASGAITATTNYDAWGNPDTAGGLLSTTPYGYAGGYTDPTGLLYLIHRYYDPTTGQFTSVDPLVDRTERPYEYASGDPVDFVDPMGLSWKKRLEHFGVAVYELGDAAVEYGTSVAIGGVCGLGYLGSETVAPIAGTTAIVSTLPACAVGTALPAWAGYEEAYAAGGDLYDALHDDSGTTSTGSADGVVRFQGGAPCRS